ncbi:hypothetical protein Sgly_0612 [Syntrophobotulus glycolicus DSM 8271]|uniref:AAA domain-containing protein n=1 Tax=Syntrophobotulus glycolicus (strain DSM 8271 / FlGlyR) TaxID=645991 RepID=F0SZW4_SYNGF|nr:MinD/ParA family protein [Syntrophobotulus glycolicus]ADY54975.1 hypothetical protein Sgly_0612 [Syntrophobotulus glycolicus DSM 8271]
MNDQASTLRSMVSQRDAGTHNNMRVIAVGSGKGGVGKTSFVVNLAIALSELNYRVIVLDGDLGLANVDVVFGMTAKYSIRHLLSGEKRIEDILCPVKRGIKVLPGASGMFELANLDRGQLKNVLVNLGRLEKMADVLLIDTGAGLGHTVLNFLCASDEVIVITTPEPPAMADAYGLLKSLKGQQEQLNLKIVINRIHHESEAEICFEKLEHAAKKFLGLRVNLLGWIYDDPLMGKSIMEQYPLGLANPESLAYKYIQWIAGNVTGMDQRPPSSSGGIRKLIFSILKN